MTTVTTGERRTIFEIEREKRWRVWLLFALLVGVVFVGIWVVCLIVGLCVALGVPGVDLLAWLLTPRIVGAVLGLSVVGSLLYWFVSQRGARDRLVRALHCKPLDPDDRYHQRLANIVEEMRIATGGPHIECLTVGTLGLNAFAFSDLRGGGVIGVTEGALARLSRQQLEAVVAHEFGHILSGNYVTVTVACLLFGIYSQLGDELEDVALASAMSRTAPLAVGAITLRGWLWVLEQASAVTNAALSRERERQADMAAARYTRDPLSLAEALHVISQHPGGAGYIPEGLAPLCIRATQRDPGRWVGWRSTHPPLQERIGLLLALAHVSPEDFGRQVDKAAENFTAREHWAVDPAAGGAGRRIGLDTAGAFLAPAGIAPLATAPTPAGAETPGAPGVSRAPVHLGERSRLPVAAGMPCPRCGAGLQRIDYEGVRIASCPACGGHLASAAQVSKTLARREAGFNDEQQHLADQLAASGDALRRAALLSRGKPAADLVACPKCAKNMMRRLFNYEYAVEIDYCRICDLFWFDRNELEALQLLAERETG
jgi:Zn-dependent protease with chaperone function/Zn-finger nucleic acid-binding protein